MHCMTSQKVAHISEGCAAILVFSLNAKAEVLSVRKITVVTPDTQFAYLVNQFANQRANQNIKLFDQVEQAALWIGNSHDQPGWFSLTVITLPDAHKLPEVRSPSIAGVSGVANCLSRVWRDPGEGCR